MKCCEREPSKEIESIDRVHKRSIVLKRNLKQLKKETISLPETTNSIKISIALSVVQSFVQIKVKQCFPILKVSTDD